MEHQNQISELKRALQEKVLLDDGRMGFIFSELVPIGPSNRWHCHVCSKTVDSERALVMHLSHPVHAAKLRTCKHPAKNFKKFADSNDNGLSGKTASPVKTEGVQNSWEMTTDVLPGEPVPPGMEDVVEGICQIQATFDEHPGPLIGLEYIVELVNSEEEREPRYICLLCEKKGDPRSLMVHVTSQNHCLKYISCFFRTAGNALNMIPRITENRKGIALAIMKIAEEIEKNYGRLKPTSAVAETFSLKKYEILRQIDEKEHFRETPSTTFASYVTPEKIQEYCLQNDLDPVESSAGPSTLPLSKPVFKGTGQNNRTDKTPTKTNKMSQGDKCEKQQGENELIEIESSISSVSSVELVDDEKDSHRTSISRDRYSSRKRPSSPDLDDCPKSSYHSSSRHRRSPPSYRSSRRTRSRSRDRDVHRRGDYYRDRDRVRRSPSHVRSRSIRSRERDRHSEERYRRRSPEHDRHGQHYRERKRRDDSRNRSRERRDRNVDMKKEIDDSKWDKYRADFHKLEITFESKLKYYEERPEKHPKYSDEWKAFWNKRYKEIQLSGKDPTTYDFKPEWIIYWAKRMKELSEEDFSKERDALKKKWDITSKPEKPSSSDLQDISPPTPESHKDVTVDDIKNTWKALTGSEITAPTNQEKNQSKRSSSPWENNSTVAAAPTISNQIDTERSSVSTRKPYDIAPPVLHCLRMLSVLESQLGSLGPRVMELLGKALVLERAKYNSSMNLLKDVDIHIFFETVKEKIRGQLIAGIVMRNLVSSSRAIIKAIETMLDTNPPVPKIPLNNSSLINRQLSVAAGNVVLTPSEPVQVPGIGMIDKMAIAEQIANALIAQGKTDVTQEELEDLINAVVGIAKASNANVSKNISSAAFFSQLNIENSTANSHINEILSNMITSAQKSLGIDTNKNETVSTSIDTVTQSVKSVVTENELTILNTVISSGLQPTQPAGINSKPIIPLADNNESSSLTQKPMQAVKLPPANEVSDDELKEKLSKFSVLPRDEQQNLISLLKQLETTQAARVENLRKYVSIGLLQMSAEKVGKEEMKDGRLSPFSSRVGGANPAPDEKSKPKDQIVIAKEDDDDDDEDDDDYSVEDVYKAASEKLFKKNEGTKIINDGSVVAKDEFISKLIDMPDFNAVLSGTMSDSNSEKMSQPLPISTNKNVLLPTADSSIPSNVQSLMDNLFGKSDTYQITLNSSHISSQNEYPNNYKSYQDNGVAARPEQYQTRNAEQPQYNFYPPGLGSENNQQFGGNIGNYSSFTSHRESSHCEQPPSLINNSQDSSRNYSTQSWQPFGHNTGPINDQYNVDAAPHQHNTTTGFFRGGSNNPPYGAGFGPNL